MIVSCNSLILLPLQTSTHIETKPIFNSSLGPVSWLRIDEWMICTSLYMIKTISSYYSTFINSAHILLYLQNYYMEVI